MTFLLRASTPTSSLVEPFSPTQSIAATRAPSPTPSLRTLSEDLDAQFDLEHDGHVRERVILVGIGGATCSGKTTLAKHLKEILPGATIVHQDDFAPPIEQIPMHPVHNVQDWDSAPGAIDWPRLVSVLKHLRENGGKFPEGHYSHDHLNEQTPRPISSSLIEQWSGAFERLNAAASARGEKIVWRLVDGFLLYWHKDVVDQLDARIFLRVPQDVLKKRRYERHGYHTAAQSDPVEGAFWKDPPGYWEQIVWPAYEAAHSKMFADGDVEHGEPKLRHVPISKSSASVDVEDPNITISAVEPDPDVTMGAPETEQVEEEGGVDNLVLIEGMEVSMDDMVRRCCGVLLKRAEELVGSYGAAPGA